MDISASIEHALANYFSQWLIAHPYLAWTIAHPLPSIGLLLLTIFSLWGLIKAIGRGIEQTWLFLLTTPFRLLQPIFGLMWNSIRGIGHNQPSDEQLSVRSLPNSPERIDDIIDRLEILRQEQDALLRELSTLAGSASLTSDPGAISDTQYQNLYAKLLK
jgi:hypothetical protein